jgi:ribosomal protein L11 methylase PrmA
LLATENNFKVIAVDNDEQCINNLYKKIKQQNISGLVPLCLDISNPQVSTGFANTERTSFAERVQADAVLALALVHHLVISKNIPLSLIASYFSRLAPQLIIEFVPKEDEKVQWLLQHKKDIYSAYTKEEFEKIFQQYFTIVSANAVPGTSRSIYLMRKKEE